MTPIIKINLKGIKEKDTKPSKATALAPKKEYLVYLFILFQLRKKACSPKNNHSLGL